MNARITIDAKLTAHVAPPDQTELLAQLYQQSFSDQIWSAQDFENWLTKPNILCLLAKYNAQYVGFICYQYWLEQTEAQSYAGEAEIILIGTKREMTRHAIASFLLQKLEQGYGIATDGALITQAFWQKIFLDVAQDNHAAINLYLKNHYRIYGKRKNYYPGSAPVKTGQQDAQTNRIDALLMEKSH